MTSPFHGVIPALMTEMKQDGALDHEATSRHLESCLKAGVDGFVMLGTLGENSSLSVDEKEAVVRLNAGIATCMAVADNASRALLEEILVGEEDHADWLETQLEAMRQIGEQNYLAQQLRD